MSKALDTFNAWMARLDHWIFWDLWGTALCITYVFGKDTALLACAIGCWLMAEIKRNHQDEYIITISKEDDA